MSLCQTGSAIISDNPNLAGPEHEVCVTQRNCKIFKKGHCRISLCNNENEQFCDSNTAWGSRAKAILDKCQRTNGGGWDGPPTYQPWTEVALIPNDQEFAAFAEKAGVFAVHESLMTVEENAAEVQRIEAQEQERVAAAQKLSMRVGAPLQSPFQFYPQICP